MKQSKYLFTALFAAVIACCTVRSAAAQALPNAYFNIDWQIGIPASNHFANNTSGWGANLEGGCFLTEHITLGGFLNYQTNFERVPRQTLLLPSGNALTTSQKHAVFQLPFGVSARYNWLKQSIFQPYAGMKVGASWAEFTSYYYIYKQDTSDWGFYLSPEVGVSIFPWRGLRYGFHAAFYYSFSTNEGRLLNYHINNLNNFGFRFGVSF